MAKRRVKLLVSKVIVDSSHSFYSPHLPTVCLPMSYLPLCLFDKPPRKFLFTILPTFLCQHSLSHHTTSSTPQLAPIHNCSQFPSQVQTRSPIYWVQATIRWPCLNSQEPSQDTLNPQPLNPLLEPEIFGSLFQKSSTSPPFTSVSTTCASPTSPTSSTPLTTHWLSDTFPSLFLPLMGQYQRGTATPRTSYSTTAASHPTSPTWSHRTPFS